MKPKKTPKADLRNKRGLFLEIGLILSLLAAILFFRWSWPESPHRPGIVVVNPIDIMELPPIPVEPPKPPEPPKIMVQQLFEILRVRPNHVRIETGPLLFDPDEMPVFVPSESGGGMEETVDDGVIDLFRVEQQPLFRGQGSEAFRLWVMQQVRYPGPALDNGVEGRVTVQFVIDSHGNLTDIEVLAAPDRSLAEETIRVLMSSPEWEPGKQRGRPVAVRFTIPIEFRIGS